MRDKPSKISGPPFREAPFQRRSHAIAAAALFWVGMAAWPQARAASPAGPALLNLGPCKPTFNEDFKTLSVSPWGPGSRWIAHTPWHGDFGDAEFVDPKPGFPFVAQPHGLRIEARKGPDGKWRAGLLSTLDEKGRGYKQSYGYFEMRAKMPPGDGVWPAFWLITDDFKTEPRIEIDTIEYYGRSPQKYFITTHVWFNDDHRSREDGAEIPVASGSLSNGFHTYGVLVSPLWLIFYLDRREVLRQKTPPELTRPLGILVNLGLGGGWPINGTTNPSYFYVDYIRAYPPPDTCGR